MLSSDGKLTEYNFVTDQLKKIKDLFVNEIK